MVKYIFRCFHIFIYLGRAKINTVCLPLTYSNAEIMSAKYVTVAGHGATDVERAREDGQWVWQRKSN